MKVLVSYTIDVDDDYRMAIKHQWGEHGQKASRQEVQSFARAVGSSNDDDIMWEWRECEDGCQP